MAQGKEGAVGSTGSRSGSHNSPASQAQSALPLNLSCSHFPILPFFFFFIPKAESGTKELSYHRIFIMFKSRIMGQPKAAVGTG